MPPRLLKIDPSNRGDHYYLNEEHECYFFYEYTSGKGYSYSDGNQFITNLKKSVLKQGQYDYQYKERAVARGAQLLRSAFLASPTLLPITTVVPIPPSKVPGDPEYDDRMSRIAQAACAGTGLDSREMIIQRVSYAASHTQQSGARMRPAELEQNYALVPPAPRSVVVLVDDVMTTGAHFVAARNVILRQYIDTRVIGIFMARRILPNPADDFEAL